MAKEKTDAGILLRFSNDEMWLKFIEYIFSCCEKSSCSEKETRECFDKWLYSNER